MESRETLVERPRALLYPAPTHSAGLGSQAGTLAAGSALEALKQYGTGSSPYFSSLPGQASQDLSGIYGRLTPRTPNLVGTPSQPVQKVALDIRELDSTRFRSLQTSAAELHQRLMSSKKGKASLDEDDDDDLAYKVLVTPVVARAISNVNQRSRGSSSGEQGRTRRIFDYSSPPHKPDDAEEAATASSARVDMQNSGPPVQRRAIPAEQEQRKPVQQSMPLRRSTPPRTANGLPNLCTSFEVRSPSELLRESEGDIPRSPNTYEITPNPLWNASPPKSSRNGSPVRPLPEASFDKVSEPAEQPAGQDSGSDGIGTRKSSNNTTQSMESQGSAGLRMTHRRTFSVDLDNAQPNAAPAPKPNARCSVQIGSPILKGSAHRPSQVAASHLADPAVSPAGSVELREGTSPRNSSDAAWRAPGYTFPELLPSPFSFRQPKTWGQWGAKPPHRALSKLSPRGPHDTEGPEHAVPVEVPPSPTDSSAATSPDRTEYKDGVNSPNTAIRKALAATPWLTRVQDFICSPSISGGSARTEAAAPKSRLSPRALDVTPQPSRQASTLEDEAAPLSGFGSPLTVSEPSAAKKPSPVQRSDTASSWTIAADFAEEDADRRRAPSALLGPLESPAKVAISPKRSVSFKLPEDDQPAPKKKSGAGSWKWVSAVFVLLALAGSCGILHSACSPEPLAACLATAATRAAAVDRINEWGSHLWTSDSSFAAGQPMGVAQKIARSIGGVGRAMLEFCGIRSRTWATEVEPHECPGNLCMGGGDHEDNEVLPLAAWYSAIKDRAAALLQCLPEEAEWLCACKAWVHRIGAAMERVVRLAGHQFPVGDGSALALSPSRQYFASVLQQADWISAGSQLFLQDHSANQDPTPEPEEAMLPGLQPTHSEHEPEPAVKEPPSVQPTRSEHDPEPAVVEPPSEEMEQTAGVATEEQPASVPEVDSPAQQPEPVEQNAAPEASAEKVDHPLLEQPEPVEQNAAGEASAEDVDHPMQTQAAPTSAAVIWGSAAGLCAIAASVFAVVRIMNQADESEGLEDGDIDDFDDGLIDDSTVPGDEEDAEEPAEDGSPARSHRSGRSEPLSTWIASKLTPNRLSKVDSPPSQLEFREMRDRTVVTAKGKLVGDLAPGAHHPADEVYHTPAEKPSSQRGRRSAAKSSAKPAPKTAPKTAAKPGARTSIRSWRPTDAVEDAATELPAEEAPRTVRRSTRRSTRSGTQF